jgi:hypothetical protein
MRAALENTLGLQPLHFFWHLLTHMEDAVFVLDDVHGNPHLIPPLALILFFEGCRELIRMLGRRKG